MSSFAGIFYTDQRPVEIRSLIAMTEPLDPGPGRSKDAAPSGHWQEASVGFAHRLEAFTPEDAFEAQPLHSPDGRFVLVADARLDNRDELGRVFGIAPGRLTKTPDSALILQACQKWGQDGPAHLLGAFAFALWDRTKHRLLLVRDHLGRRTLFYYPSGDGIAFASTLHGLLRLPGVPRTLNAPKIADYLLRTTAAPEETFFKGVYRVPLAHTLEVTRERTTRRRYWSLEPKREIRYKRDEDYVEAFRELFDDAVRVRLRSAHPIGSHLSGGLDSSSVAAVAAGLLDARGERLATFTALPPEGFTLPFKTRAVADERPYIDAVLGQYPTMDSVRVTTGEESFLNDLEASFEAAGAPISNVQNRMWAEAISAEAAQRGTRVLLTGQGGNLTISWNGRLIFPELFWRGQWGQLVRMLKLSASAQDRSLGVVFRKQVLAPFLPGVKRRAVALGGRTRTDQLLQRALLNPEFAERERLVERIEESAFRSPWRVELPDGRRRRLAFFTGGPMHESADFLEATRSRYGVDLRDPTLDKRVVEYCLGIPLSQFISHQGPGHDGERMLIRRAMETVLPPRVLQRTQRGVQAANWYQAFDPIQEKLHADLNRFDASMMVQSLLDLPRLRTMLSEWSSQDLTDRATHEQYGSFLSMAIVAGHYLLWFERQTETADASA